MTRPGSPDRALLTAVSALLGVGLVYLFSSSAGVSARLLSSPHDMLVSQGMKALVGVLLMVLVSRFDYVRMGGFGAWSAWLGSIALLALLLFPNPLSETVRQTDRWLRIGGFRIQPAEFARVAVIVLLAWLASRIGTRWRPRDAAPLAVVVAVPIACIVCQPNFGTATTMGLSALAVLVIAGMPWTWLATGAIALGGALSGLTLVYRYPLERVLSWGRSFGQWEEQPFQIQQGLIALGSGGPVGVGLGQSIQKRQFVPDAHTDLILAIIGEEVGLLGTLTLCALMGVLVWRGLRIARAADERFGYLLAAGLSVQLALYFVINAGVVTGLLPVTGLPLPFVSYGGSALLANLLAVGLLLSVSRHASWRRPLAPRVIASGVRKGKAR